MDTKEFEASIDETLSTCKNILVGKGLEYHEVNNVFASFERVSAQTGVNRMVIAEVFLQKHLDSIFKYIKAINEGKPPSLSEPINLRFCDAINYLLFIDAMAKKQTQKETK